MSWAQGFYLLHQKHPCPVSSNHWRSQTHLIWSKTLPGALTTNGVGAELETGEGLTEDLTLPLSVAAVDEAQILSVKNKQTNKQKPTATDSF